MKIHIEVDERIKENEVVIRCNEFTEDIQHLQELIQNQKESKKLITFFQGEKEYYLPLSAVLFFETDGKTIIGHTRDDVYQVKYRLFELEQILPMQFMRVSKSAIVNTATIYAITRNITASSTIEFNKTHKKIFVSRHYYNALKEFLEEKRK